MKAVNLSVFFCMIVTLAYSEKGKITNTPNMDKSTSVESACAGYYWKKIVISPGTKLFYEAHLPNIGKEYKVAFDLEITSSGSGYHSVIHFSTGGGCCDYGQRIPAVFTSGAAHIQITSAVNGKGNYYKDFPIDPQDNKYHIEISQSLYSNKYWYNIAINQVSVFTIENTDAQKFDNVEIWAGDPVSWGYPALDGILTNVCVDI